MYPEHLDFKVFETGPDGDAAQRLFILCHGFGAPGNDLVPVAEEVISALAADANAPKTRIVVPVAPLQLDEFEGYDARAWWKLNMRALEEMVGSGNLDVLCKSVPKGIESARELFLDLLKQQTDELNLPLSQVVLGGFSQGAMLATDVTLRLPELIGGLVVLSGFLICEDDWTRFAETKSGLKVLQTHGDMDPVLPIAGAHRLAQLLQNCGADVQFGAFHGPHTIPMGSAEAIAQLIVGVETKA